MPSATSSRSTFTFQSWRGPKQNRHHSTGQEFQTVHDNERMSAMLRGTGGNKGRKETLRTPPEHAASSHSSQQSAASSPPNVRTSSQSNQRSDRSHNQIQQGQLGVSSRTRKRKATASLGRPSARRQRGNTPELKDEAYIRSTMHMPTPEQYPGAPSNVFKHPKDSIHSLTRDGLAKWREEFTALADNAHQCTAYYTSATHNQVVIGEGRTKASRSET